MLDRLIATLALWGLRGGLAWFVAHEYVTVVSDKLNSIARALGGL